jgi:hypothetical protein
LSVFIHFDPSRIYPSFIKKKKRGKNDIPGVNTYYPKNLILITVWLLTPIVLSFIISWSIIPLFVDRYFIGCSGAFYLLAARGLSRLGSKKILFPTLFVILFFTYFPLKESYFVKDKDSWKEVTSFIEQRYQKSDVIFLQPGYIQIAFDRYYQKTASFRKVHRGLNSDEKIQRFIQNSVRNKERIWLVVRFEPFPFSMNSYLQKRFGKESLVLKQSFHGVMIYLFDIKN